MNVNKFFPFLVVMSREKCLVVMKSIMSNKYLINFTKQIKNSFYSYSNSMKFIQHKGQNGKNTQSHKHRYNLRTLKTRNFVYKHD